MKRLNAVFLVILALLGPASQAAQQTNLGPTTATTLAVGQKTPAATGTIFDVASTTKAGRPCPPMTQTQRDAIASPATGSCVFNTTTSTLNQYTGTAWSAVSGGSGGAKNYIANGNAETNSTTGWNKASVTWSSGAPSGAPTIGTAASFAALAVSSSSPLAGTYSYLFNNVNTSTNYAQGDGVCTDAITIDAEDQAKVLAFRYYYSFANGTSMVSNFSGTSSNTFANYFYDVTNSAWIQPAGVYNLIQTVGTGISQGTWQTPSNMTQFRQCIFVANATTGQAAGSVATFKVDDDLVGPQSLAFGPPDLDAVSFTPTGSWENTTYSGFYKRHGDMADITYQLLVSSAPTTAALTLNPPSGLTIDTTKLPSTAGYRQFGTLQGKSAGHGITGFCQINSPQTTFQPIYINDGFTASNMTVSGISKTAPYTFTTNDILILNCDNVPIVGWGGNTAQSADTDTRVVAFNATTATGTVDNTGTAITGWTMVKDTHGGWNGTNTYTVPMTGYYFVDISFRVDATFAVGNYVFAGLVKNGSTLFNVLDRASGAQVSMMPRLTNIFYFNAGDQLKTEAQSNATTPAYAGSNQYDDFSVVRISGPAVISATETVAAKYTGSTTTIGTTATVIIQPTKVYDTHGAYNSSTGVFTVPVQGKYKVCASSVSGTNVADSSTGLGVQLFARKNSSSDSFIGGFSYQVAATTLNPTIVGCATVSVIAGDTLDVAELRSANVTSFALEGNNTDVWTTIERVGN